MQCLIDVCWITFVVEVAKRCEAFYRSQRYSNGAGRDAIVQAMQTACTIETGRTISSYCYRKEIVHVYFCPPARSHRYADAAMSGPVRRSVAGILSRRLRSVVARAEP